MVSFTVSLYDGAANHGVRNRATQNAEIMSNRSFHDLLNGYIGNQLTDEELAHFLQMMQQEEHQHALKATIEQLFSHPSASGLPDQKRADIIFRKIMDAAGKQEELPGARLIHTGSGAKRLTLAKIAVAASVLLIVGLGGKLWFGHRSETPAVVQEKNSTSLKDTLSAVVRHEINNTGQEKSIRLPDGSLVVMANNSEVTYSDPFGPRDVSLTGKAYFKVAKDKTRPFTVTSGDVSTTALGTEFTVTAFHHSGQVIIRLYEGKVVVKALNKANQNMKKDVYLLPGQAFVYGGETMAQVKSFRMKPAAAPGQIISDELLRDHPPIPENAETPYFMFNNHPLAQVFDQLAKMYQVQIIYDKNDVQNIYFTRKYNATDPVENILKEITTLNNLQVTRKTDTFIISK